jgi:hypothetical protein
MTPLALVYPTSRSPMCSDLLRRCMHPQTHCHTAPVTLDFSQRKQHQPNFSEINRAARYVCLELDLFTWSNLRPCVFFLLQINNYYIFLSHSIKIVYVSSAHSGLFLDQRLSLILAATAPY